MGRSLLNRRRQVVVILLAALWTGCSTPGAEQKHSSVESSDSRAPIAVDVATRAAVLAEMQMMLTAVQGIVAAAATNDTAQMRTAALGAGTAAASEADSHAAEQLGADFVQLGMSTHQGFDSLSADAARGRDVVLERLAALMSNCVACHARWRLTVQP